MKKSHRIPATSVAAVFALLPVYAAAQTEAQLAGNSLPSYPFFEYVRAINEDATMEVAIDPSRFPGIVGQNCDIYVVAAKTASQWLANAISMRPIG